MGLPPGICLHLNIFIRVASCLVFTPHSTLFSAYFRNILAICVTHITYCCSISSTRSLDSFEQNLSRFSSVKYLSLSSRYITRFASLSIASSTVIVNLSFGIASIPRSVSFPNLIMLDCTILFDRLRLKSSMLFTSAAGLLWCSFSRWRMTLGATVMEFSSIVNKKE